MRRKHPPGPAVQRRRAFVRAGFSLIELIVVIFLIGITAAIVVPRFGASQSRYHALSSARRVAADLAAARTRADAVSAGVFVEFKPGSPRYTIQTPSAGTSTQADLSSEPFVAVVTAADFGGEVAAAFDAFGNAAKPGSVSVQSQKTACDVTLSASGVVGVSAPYLVGMRVTPGKAAVAEEDK